MNNILLLVRNYYKMFLAKFTKNKDKGLLIGFIAIMFSLLFTVFFAYISYTTIITSITAGMPSLALSSFSTTLLMFVFMLIVTESSPTNKHTDESMLLSLPITKRQIIASKIIFYLTFDLIIIGLLLLPSYVIYYLVVDGVSFALVVRALYVIILSTMFATGVAGLISVFFVRITKSFKYSNIIRTSLSVLLLLVFVVFYCFFAFLSQDVEKAGKIYEIYPITLITSFIGDANIISFIILTIIGLTFFISSILVRAYFTGKALNTYQSKNKELVFSEKSVSSSLYKREFTKYLSIPIYVSNTIFGPLFIILISVIICFIGKTYFIDMIDAILSVGYESGTTPPNIISGIDSYFNIGLIVIFSLILTSSPTTASSISLEGKELWILKAHPISYKDCFIAKILVNLTVTLIPLLICVVLLMTRIDFITIIFLFIIPALSCILSSIIGLYVNLVYPKLVWESEHEVVKQGFSVIVTLVINSVMIILPYVIYFMLEMNPYIKLSIIAIVFVLLNIVWFAVLMKKGKTLYNKL